MTAAQSPPAAGSAADPASAPVIELEGVVVAFGALVALDDITFSVAPGATVGVVGPNGAGKTTLLNAISGFAPLRQGEVRAFGQRVNGTAPEQLAAMGIGRSFQLADQFGRMTVADFMMLGLTTRLSASLAGAGVRWRSVRREEAAARDQVVEELEIFGLDYLSLATRLQELPYGVRKRLDIARAAISHPKVLLVDEPTSGLATSESEEMAAVLRTLVGQRDATLLIVDHRVSFVTDLCPTLIALDFGRLIGDGPSDKVLADPQVRKAFLGIADEEL